MSPAEVAARLHEIADGWEADMPGHAHYAAHWRLRGDGLREGLAEGRVRQLNDCAAAVRNLANDLAKEVVLAPTYTVALPANLPLLNANQRWHFADRADYTRGIRQAARLLAADLPAMKRAHIIAEYRPRDRRRRDVHNFYPSAKAAVDGLVDAGVLPDDADAYLVGPDMRVGEIEPAGGRLLLHITELEVPRGDD